MASRVTALPRIIINLPILSMIHAYKRQTAIWNEELGKIGCSLKMYLNLVFLILIEFHLTKSSEILRPRGVSISSNVFLR
jgi:hypothetical protein